MEMIYTLCFIQNQQDFLMLLRSKEPHAGQWNGVGGKIENNETPKTAAIREIEEETGLYIPELSFKGTVTWNRIGGLYLFLGNSDTREVKPFSDEGRLEWKSLDWILSGGNVVSNIPVFLPRVLAEKYEPIEFAFQYDEQDRMLGYDTRPLQGEKG